VHVAIPGSFNSVDQSARSGPFAFPLDSFTSTDWPTDGQQVICPAIRKNFLLAPGKPASYNRP
jgi:hypothetical protein